MAGKKATRKYGVPVYVTMHRTFEVEAASADEAKKLAEKRLLGGGVLLPENCMEWDEVTEEREVAEPIRFRRRR